jgi:DNA-binding response OmpR family regulator
MADGDRILVVDDEAAICHLIVRILASDGHVAEAVGSAEEALPKVANNAFDLYILDKNLPGKNGIALAAEVRAIDRAAGILILTGFASRDSALDALHIGVDGYVEKPVKRDVLAARVNEALAGASRRRSLSDRLSSARAAARSALDHLDKPGALGIVLAHADPDKATQLATRLSARGAVETVTDLATLEARLSGAMPDLVLADTELGDITPTLRQAHDRHPELAIVVTGQAPSLRQVQALIFAGVRAVIEQPLTANGLHEQLVRELDALRKH